MYAYISKHILRKWYIEKRLICHYRHMVGEWVCFLHPLTTIYNKRKPKKGFKRLRNSIPLPNVGKSIVILSNRNKITKKKIHFYRSCVYGRIRQVLILLRKMHFIKYVTYTLKKFPRHTLSIKSIFREGLSIARLSDTGLIDQYNLSPLPFNPSGGEYSVNCHRNPTIFSGLSQSVPESIWDGRLSVSLNGY